MAHRVHPNRLRRRMLQVASAGAASLCLPMLNLGRYQLHAASAQRYSARAVRIVERSLVIDMLAPLKIDFRPEAYAGRISEADEQSFRSSRQSGSERRQRCSS